MLELEERKKKTGAMPEAETAEEEDDDAENMDVVSPYRSFRCKN